jgi:hypothetical protein
LAALAPLPADEAGAGVAAGVDEEELSFGDDDDGDVGEELPEEAVSEADALLRLSVR